MAMRICLVQRERGSCCLGDRDFTLIMKKGEVKEGNQEALVGEEGGGARLSRMKMPMVEGDSDKMDRTLSL